MMQTASTVLTLNAGSSSIRFAIFAATRTQAFSIQVLPVKGHGKRLFLEEKPRSIADSVSMKIENAVNLLGLEAMGIVLDAERNAAHDPERISADGSAVMVRRMAPEEERMIARHVVRLMTARNG